MVGDGSAMYTIQSLWTQAREGLDVLTIVFANRTYQILRGEFADVGAGKPGQRRSTCSTSTVRRSTGWRWPRAWAFRPASVTTADELVKALAEAMPEKGPRLIEVQM